MSYRDPYSGHYAAGASTRYGYESHQQPHYADPQQQQQYPTSQSYRRPYYDDDMANEPEEANPYMSNSNSNGNFNNNAQSYNLNDERHIGEQPDYSYGENARAGAYDYPPVQRDRSVRSVGRSRTGDSFGPARKEASGFDQGEFGPPAVVARKSRTPRALREYRYDHQGNLWTKGGRGRCAGRVCCCSLMTAVFLIVSIVLTLALYARPPNIEIGDVQAVPVNGSVLQMGGSSGLDFQVNLGVAISVSNPNYFSVGLKKIDLELTYPINDTPVGGGETKDINFKANSQTNFTFPFHLTYNPVEDPSSAILSDLLGKCGANPQNVVINYKITLGIRILIITVSPVVSNQFNFRCPVDLSNLSKIAGGLGLREDTNGTSIVT
ncbi:hypothetical protein JR316_0003144 [Psilocybe cubensis]|uniref:Late embryogenesis abundant protein LEA-2 subgroup domain-containing protein n=2 Tax=Psilocybe cubensis TaxID=181762 RepID=A0A8H7Y084_PSICU|nr:hypothetical protein JR316_0003144 [Psilocybe cubensis]KAH9483674.1 hypothetical protein JR316_0003144 [Psilocybe cubensis]